MKPIDPMAAVREAVAAHPARPATAIVLESDDVRLVVFRIAPGQAVPPHRSPSSVLLTVLSGAGVISGEGEEQTCTGGAMVAFEPGELHGMRADDVELCLLATITPRPGTR